MARPRKTTRRKAARKRQPKRILNAKPSPKTEEDWTFETAAEADMVMAAPPIPASKDLRATWWNVGDQGSTGSCVGWACADSVLALALRQERPHRADDAALAAVRLDGVEGDGPVHHQADDLHRDGGDEHQDRPRRRPQVRRRQGLDPAVRLRQALPRPGEHLLRGRGRSSRSSPTSTWAPANQLAHLARHQGADPHAAERRRHVVRRDGQRRQPRRLPPGHHARRARGRARRLHVHRFIVRNSWGTDWGDDGFAYASLGYAAGAFTEAYGVEA